MTVAQYRVIQFSGMVCEGPRGGLWVMFRKTNPSGYQVMDATFGKGCAMGKLALQPGNMITGNAMISTSDYSKPAEITRVASVITLVQSC